MTRRVTPRALPPLRSLLAAMAALFAMTAMTASASAQLITHEEGESYRSPQNFAVEVRVAPYRPSVDAAFSGGQTPYADYFGTGRELMMQLEFDWQIVRGFGSLALGGMAGRFKDTGKAYLSDGSGRSGDNTTFELIPLALSVVYRFDVLAERLSIPVVPYAKIGLDYDVWTITDGNGTVPKEDASGRKGRGATWGWHQAVGLALLLDFLDPSAARSLDSEVGVNHTYLFGELRRADVSGLGQSNKMHVGDTTVYGGILFEM